MHVGSVEISYKALIKSSKYLEVAIRPTHLFLLHKCLQLLLDISLSAKRVQTSVRTVGFPLPRHLLLSTLLLLGNWQSRPQGYSPQWTEQTPQPLQLL